MTAAAPRRRRRARRVAIGLVVLALVTALVSVAAITTDTLGAGHLFDRAVARVDRFLAGPVPDRSAPVTVLVPQASVDPEELDPDEVDPSAEPSAPATPVPTIGPPPTPAADPTATPLPTPRRVAVDYDSIKNYARVFAHEQKITWCASAAVQMVIAVHGKGDNSNGFQREIQGRVREWESRADSRNGDWGPSAMALALDAYGVPGYEVRAYKTRQNALRDAARAIQATKAPVILLAWRGAHAWVMTGFRADADPSVFKDAKIKGAYIMDPWYPDISSIWGPSDKPGAFQDNDEMIRNYLKWQRPEGHYPDRDGLYISVVPTVVRS
ncbi:MAG TPA: papain-like cysteine protease family protein [Candidatus Limnocylindrales bacterium]